MADTIPLNRTWVELYTTLNISAGTPLIIQNIGDTNAELILDQTNLVKEDVSANVICSLGKFTSTWEVADTATSAWVRARGTRATLVVTS